MRRLAEFKEVKKIQPEVYLSAIAGKDVIVHGYDYKPGFLRLWCVLDVELPDESRVNVLTSDKDVIEVLVMALANGAFPVQARFVRTKKGWDIQ